MVIESACCPVATEDWSVECVGYGFVKYLSKLHSTVDDEVLVDEDDTKECCQIEVDLDYLKSLDPKECKSQDHYAVLGLKEVRYKATFSDIKTAYRQMVLNHHPDKRKARGEKVIQDSDYFTCITFAWEILGDPTKRKSYDSVDPYFDDNVPSASDFTDEQFFKVFGEVFARNSRWSEKQPVPKLGSLNDSRESVESFYSFWYNFESWREYSYEDEESKEKGQDREERRWIEKKNKTVRAKKKKEELARIRSLVDNAYKNDPRIKRFLLEDKERKNSQKKAKAEAARLRAEEAEARRKAEEDERRKQKEAEEAAEREKQEAAKAEKEAAKRALKREKKTFRDVCKAADYFAENEDDKAENMRRSGILLETLSVDELKQLNALLKEDGGDPRAAFIAKVKETETRLEQERLAAAGARSGHREQGTNNISSAGEWSAAQMALLVKAVNIFPAGTSQRWEVVANFVNQHSPESTHRTAKQVLIKAKEMQDKGTSDQVKAAANTAAYEAFERAKRSSGKVEAEASKRLDEPTPWTADEQKLLEQALKTYPATAPDRWESVAACLPTRTKKECMRRYKELVEMVRAKKMAAQAL